MPRLAEIIRALKGLKKIGWIKATRSGPTAVGHTLETALGLRESNIQIPDLGGRVEIKATRRNSSSLVTLFTFNRGAWLIPQRDVIKTYGYFDAGRGRRALYSTAHAGTPNAQGFVLRVQPENQTIILMRGPKEIAAWNAYRLVGALLYKLGKLLYVIADSRLTEKGTEEFHFNEAYLLEEPSPENFISAFESSAVYLDIRMHLKPDGTVRNHGTGFRIREADLGRLFARRRKLV